MGETVYKCGKERYCPSFSESSHQEYEGESEEQGRDTDLKRASKRPEAGGAAGAGQLGLQQKDEQRHDSDQSE
jgi:hypothetical protein